MRWFAWTVSLVGLLGLAAVAALFLALWSSLPQVEGQARLPGLTAPVDVVRDTFGIPHIEAADEADAYRALGYAHAQDRLWQMEFHRRIGAGRLAEAVGPAGLPYDRLSRALDLHGLAEASEARLPPDALRLFQAYADGVNALLSNRNGLLPPEFLVLGIRPEPWTVADSLVLTRLMALDLAENWRRELLRLRLRTRLDDAHMADLWPDANKDGPVTLAGAPSPRHLAALAAALPPAPPDGQGSNAWVLAGSRTATGKPLLANDPHMSNRIPGVWYLAHLSAPGLNVIGATIPGLPAVVLGRNDHIAWGFTNTGGDVQDLFVEEAVPDRPGFYRTPEGVAPFTTRREVVRVKGGESVTLDIRSTRHGPILSDVIGEESGTVGRDRLIGFAWSGLDANDITPATGFRLARARDWDGFVEAIRTYTSPQQNIHYADVDGRIGFYAPGHLPVREGGDGFEAVPGAEAGFDWRGTIPFDELPHAVDPPSGRLFNANNAVVGPDYPHLITREWEEPLRARRLDERLAGGGYDLGDMRRLQHDTMSMLARDLLPVMIDQLGRSGPLSGEARRLLAWDRVAAPDRIEPLIFHAWYAALARRLYGDELGDLFDSYAGSRAAFTKAALLGGTRVDWCDDVSTADRGETCPGIVRAAWADALAWLTLRFGADRAAWRWGSVHVLELRHPVLDRLPLGNVLAGLDLPMGGDGTSLNVGHARYDLSSDEPFTVRLAASYRGLYDLAEPDRSRFVATVGQSGHPLSRHYRDMSEIWLDGGDVAMSMRPADYRADAVRILRLSQ
ncbi:penicillin acylase family protein [Marinivivus vitaminiproducens]|uniref:penicillin acylase family protein n=1 Tax=Marinivivus vitaminiproducens TaxID=3035935 RepID=UPI0027A937AE|nr:penicillin acylase family protein [Geminicoccaceae bacterium SCSIO 64248]